MHAAELLDQRGFFYKKFKMVDEDSHSTDRSVSGETIFTKLFLILIRSLYSNSVWFQLGIKSLSNAGYAPSLEILLSCVTLESDQEMHGLMAHPLCIQLLFSSVPLCLLFFCAYCSSIALCLLFSSLFLCAHCSSVPTFPLIPCVDDVSEVVVHEP